MKLSPEGIAALQQSIEHWEQVVAEPLTTPIGGEHCALCARYKSPSCHASATDPEYAEQCPVAKASGRDQCEASPYPEVADRRATAPDYVQCAQEMLDFLKDLLPE